MREPLYLFLLIRVSFSSRLTASSSDNGREPSEQRNVSFNLSRLRMGRSETGERRRVSYPSLECISEGLITEK